eukprot:UN18471
MVLYRVVSDKTYPLLHRDKKSRIYFSKILFYETNRNFPDD